MTLTRNRMEFEIKVESNSFLSGVLIEDHVMNILSGEIEVDLRVQQRQSDTNSQESKESTKGGLLGHTIHGLDVNIKLFKPRTQEAHLSRKHTATATTVVMLSVPLAELLLSWNVEESFQFQPRFGFEVFL